MNPKTRQYNKIDSGMIEAGHLVSFWDERTDSQRQGVVVKITDRFYHIRAGRLRRKVPINEKRFYLIEDNKFLEVVETP